MWDKKRKRKLQQSKVSEKSDQGSNIQRYNQTERMRQKCWSGISEYQKINPEAFKIQSNGYEGKGTKHRRHQGREQTL